MMANGGNEELGLSSTNSSYIFSGTFDGNGYEIKNIYQNFVNQSNVNAALFGRANNGEIKNLTVTGKSYSYGGAGGIVGCTQLSGNGTTCNIYDCINKGEAEAGILGLTRGQNVNLVNCYNIGNCTNGIVTQFSGADWNSVLELNIKNTYNIRSYIRWNNRRIYKKQCEFC